MKNIVIIGASSDLADAVIPMLLGRNCNLLLHCGKRSEKLEKYLSDDRVDVFSKTFKEESDCSKMVSFCRGWRSRIDGLLILMGGVNHPYYWEELGVQDYSNDYLINAVFPIAIASGLIELMKDHGGRIVFVSTASAKHGGGKNSLSYGMAKAALECATKRLAKDLAQYDILVNAIAPGYLDTSMQLRAKGKPASENTERLKTIPIGRAGTKQEFAGLVDYLFSDDASFITGQIIALDGGDFI